MNGLFSWPISLIVGYFDRHQARSRKTVPAFPVIAEDCSEANCFDHSGYITAGSPLGGEKGDADYDWLDTCGRAPRGRYPGHTSPFNLLGLNYTSVQTTVSIFLSEI